MSTTNIEVQYMFSTWDRFTNQLKQIFRSLEKELIAKDKLKNIRQTILVIVYLTEF